MAYERAFDEQEELQRQMTVRPMRQVSQPPPQATVHAMRQEEEGPTVHAMRQEEEGPTIHPMRQVEATARPGQRDELDAALGGHMITPQVGVAKPRSGGVRGPTVIAMDQSLESQGLGYGGDPNAMYPAGESPIDKALAELSASAPTTPRPLQVEPPNAAPPASATGAIGDRTPRATQAQVSGGQGGAAPANTGVAGGVDRGGPTPIAPGNRAAAAQASREAGFTDIEGTDPLTTGNYVGSLEGFNTGGWGTGERGSGTMKNKFGQIASRYDPTQPGAAQSLLADEDFRSYWPNATIVEHPNQDLIDFDGPGGDPPVDVLRAAKSGGAGEAWAWQPQGGGGATAGGGSAGQDLDNLFAEDPQAKINAEIEAILSGQNPEEQNLVQRILRGEP